jgi:catechol 2,3-dioxygenase-like lactoylglutathione lyase family enzyme
MKAKLDHVVFWVADPLASLTFYEQVVGFGTVRAQEFKDGTAPFPSIRISEDSIFDLMFKGAAELLDGMVGAEGVSGHPVNHLCFALEREDYDALQARLAKAGVTMSPPLQNSFGARGPAPEAFYFLDLDRNVLEARYYP